MADPADPARALIEADQLIHDLRAQLAHAATQLAHTQAVADSVPRLEADLAREHAAVQQLQAQLDAKQRDVQLGEDRARTLLDAVQREKDDRLAVEEQLAALRTLHTALATSHSSLEASLQSATSASRTALLKLQTSESAVASLTSSKDFLASELAATRASFAAHRADAHATLLAVQTELEEATTARTAADAALATLRDSHAGLTARFATTLDDLATAKADKDAAEAAYASEVAGLKRLVDVMDARERDRKAALDAVESALDAERRDARAREDALQDALDAAHATVDRLEAELAAAPPPAPLTDAQDTLLLSPSAVLALKHQKHGRSYADVYSDYVRIADELRVERAEARRLGECLEGVLRDIQERAPILQAQRVEYDRLSLESTSLATQLAAALSSLSTESARAAGYKADLDRLQRVEVVQNQQLVDLGRQVRSLSRLLGVRQNGLPADGVDDADEDPDEIQRRLEARAEADGTTDAVVSAHLVTFASINDLVVQNQKLLRITREMGLRFEAGAHALEGQRDARESDAVREAHDLLVQLREEVESLRGRLDAAARERDMLRRLAARPTAALPPPFSSSDDGSDARPDDNLGDVQRTFEAYRTEMEVDTARLRDDLSHAQRELAGARTDAAKERARGEFLSERYRLLEDNFKLQTSEIGELAKRVSALQQTVAKHEDAAHKLREEAHELRSANDQLRHENTNFKSEREVWKSVENRLVEENTALNAERSHLAGLMRNLQAMQNELERSGSESRRRLEDQVARLDGQSVELKEKLAQEVDAGRQLALRKELEAKTYQDRLDKLTAEHQTTREALVVAKTTQEHLEQRVADLGLQVAAREEKLAVYEGRSSAGGADAEDASRTREEQLEASVAGLRAELREAKEQLKRASEHVEQYKAIAETEGDALRDLTATFDAYKLATDGSIAEKEADITSLRERLSALSADLTAANTQNSELHRTLETDRTTFEKERKAFEDALSGLRAADEATRSVQLAAQDDLRRQAQLAKEAHEKYDRELVAHADDVRRLSEIKDELETVRATVSQARSDADVARANLTASEASWSRQKEALEHEIADLRKRTDDLNGQNAVLHAQLETFGTQAALLQSRLSAIGDGDPSGATPAPDQVDAIASSMTSTVEQLREVVRFLRREKEVVDLQLDLSQQEATRLRQKLESTTKNLDEARQALTEERSKSGDTLVSAAQHAELLERIHTAQVLRESNQTLRDERDGLVARVAQLDTRLRQATAELDPLKEKVHTLEAAIEAKDQNIRLLEEDNERWKVRNQSILAKYERIDPEELRVLKEEVEQLRAAKGEIDEVRALVTAAESAKAVAETQLATTTQALTASKERFRSLQEMARKQREEIKDVADKLSEATKALETTEAARTQLASEKEQLEAQLVAAQARAASLEGRPDAPAPEALAELERKVVEAEQKMAAAESANASIVARNARLLADNKQFLQDKNAAIHEKTAGLAQQQKVFEEKHAEAIEAAVSSRLALIPPPVSASDESIAEAVQKQVAEATARLDAERNSAVALAVSTATAQLEAELAKAREDLAAASSSTTAMSTDAAAQINALKAEFEASKKALEGEFEQVKARLADEAKAREVEITERLTAEIAQAKAAVPTSAASGDAPPPVDVDALVATKLAELEADRVASQKKAIDDAVAAAVATNQATHEAELAKLTQSIKEQELKNKNLLLRLQTLTAKLKAATTAAAPTETTSTAAPSGSGAPASSAATPLPPLKSETAGASPPASNGGAGRGSVRGTPATRARGASAGRGVRGAARGAAPAVPSIGLRGAAARSGAAPAGSVLSRLLDGGLPVPVAVKRGRDDEEQSGEGGGVLGKRLKGPPTPKAE